MRTLKLAIVGAFGILTLPSAVLADTIGNNTALVTTYAETSYKPGEVVLDARGKPVMDAQGKPVTEPGYSVRQEKSSTAYSGHVEIKPGLNESLVFIRFGNESRVVRVETPEKALTLKESLTSQKSVKLIFHALDCKGTNCKSVPKDAYTPAEMEIVLNNVSEPLQTYLASTSPTTDELVANQLNQMQAKGLTQPAQAQPTSFRVYAHNILKDVKDTLDGSYLTPEARAAINAGSTLGDSK